MKKRFLKWIKKNFSKIMLSLDLSQVLLIFFVLFVKEGKILGLHTSTVDSQKDPFTKLNNEQYEELKSIYFDYINKTFEIVCDEAC